MAVEHIKKVSFVIKLFYSQLGKRKKSQDVSRNLIRKVDSLQKEQQDLSHLHSGSYILKLERGKSTASEQFVIR